MARNIVPEAETLLDELIPVLDHGFVRLVDYLGGDARIVQAARVSYGEGTKTQREDRALIHYLLRNRHTSPFEQVVLTFHCKLPIFVARQWIRHRTARVNELSGRYSVMRDEFYVPGVEVVRLQSEENKQGRQQRSRGEQQLLFNLLADKVQQMPAPVKRKLKAGMGAVPREFAQQVIDLLTAEQAMSYHEYAEMLDSGIARELARINLPLSLYTEWYWQIDLHNLFHFLKLRLDSHAQYEIREYAKVLGQCARAVAPLAYEAFEEHELCGARFSRSELKLLRKLLDEAGINKRSKLGKHTKLNQRRLTEFKSKLWGEEEPFVPEIKPVDRGEPEKE
jgi:thymidylate synthase (FAD)